MVKKMQIPNNTFIIHECVVRKVRNIWPTMCIARLVAAAYGGAPVVAPESVAVVNGIGEHDGGSDEWRWR